MKSGLEVARAVLLDIEGTTTPIAFVTGTLFPFARRHLSTFLRGHAGEVEDDVARLRDEHAGEPDREGLPAWSEGSDAERLASAEAYVHWLMDRDRKSPGLKALQGRIWRSGYDSGELLSPLYPDVVPALERWRASGRTISIYSSGSVEAQLLLFRNTEAGDLTGYFRCYFDTSVGPKVSEASYRTIASRLALPAAEILFVSDARAEVDAAARAGMGTALCARDAAPPPGPHRVITSFDGLG